MFGWINDCVECLVLTQHGPEAWHKIKEKANCNTPDGGFLRYKYYHDKETVDLVVAASEVLGASVDDVLYAFGDFFIFYVRDNGYSSVLECLGGNLRDWLSNLNSLHDQLQAAYPEGFVAPVFWSEDDDEEEGAILVHYHSRRGSLLVPLVVGLIKRVATDYFDIDIKMDQLQLQDADGAKNTSWRVTTVDPEMVHKIRGKKRLGDKHNNNGGGPSDDQTFSTAQSTNYNATFKEGNRQASYLRVEEFVKRSFYNDNSELFHALTVEHYLYLVDYWKQTKINDKWCFEIWSIQDGDPKSWAALADLPPKLNPKTIESVHFGGKTPKTGAFPPTEDGTLQSFPPKLRVNNVSSGKFIDLTVPVSETATLEEAFYTNPQVDEAKVKEFPPEIEEEIKNNEVEIQCVIWDERKKESFHTFVLSDLSTTTTKQLFDLVPVSFDPIVINVQTAKVLTVDDDEEDI
ncbi:unnamed protein product [Cylindrotheca closterium]|uniref:Heme NO-binding domain-containing protein n=1 Tax=Cylindrotheca closterium TaxID=2856 RepID=A0AAD2JJ74_9STRA|nr:unnamed protein product [Cylindrotheca closterium]